MAESGTLGGDETIWVGEDKTFKLHVLDGKSSLAASLPVNITAWAITFEVRASVADPAVLLSKTASITGSYDGSSRTANTQRAVVTVTDTDLALAVFPVRTPTAAEYRYSWKRTDDGSETILREGVFKIQRATQV